MERRATLHQLITDQSGAVAATYALSLFGLIAAVGVGYDFARLATMNTELHNAADQAALAAATQLTGKAGAIASAKAAADGAANSFIKNKTLLANDTNVTGVTIATFVFYKTKADAEADDESKAVDQTAATADADARFVKVKVTTRTVFYAFTPIVNVIASSPSGAAATAGMGSAICKVPPVMMCNTAVNPANFDFAAIKGKGIVLKGTGGGGAWAPGDFGFLDVGAGANDLGKLLAYGSPPGTCVDVANPSTEPGSMASVINDFNTRFDIFESGDNINCYSGSKCPASDNNRTDLVQSGNLTYPPTMTLQDCGIKTGNGNKGWQASNNPYRPTTAAACSATNTCGPSGSTYPDAMGYPRDLEHAIGDPIANGVSRIGSGTWDINAYWQVNYGAAYTSQVGGKTMPTRYEVYEWERQNNAAASRQFNSGGNFTAFRAPICRAGAAPGPTQPDRRLLPVAVVNCTGLTGKKPIVPIDWIDVFLVEPSIDRERSTGQGNNKVTTRYTNKGDIYVEAVRRNEQAGEGASIQFVRRDKPYLVR